MIVGLWLWSSAHLILYRQTRRYIGLEVVVQMSNAAAERQTFTILLLFVLDFKRKTTESIATIRCWNDYTD
jgi:hypothetical protein